LLFTDALDKLGSLGVILHGDRNLLAIASYRGKELGLDIIMCEEPWGVLQLSASVQHLSK
jgi:hypothetical protein